MTPFLILGATLHLKFKATIWVHQYTYLGSLVPPTKPTGSVSIFPPATTDVHDTTTGNIYHHRWAMAACIQHVHQCVHGTLSHRGTIHVMCRIIRVYDEQFRHIHTLVPSVPWHATKWKLAMDVVLGDMNWSAAHRPPQQTFWDYHPQWGSADSHFTQCHIWNSTGQCHFTNCHFNHTCSACRQ